MKIIFKSVELKYTIGLSGSISKLSFPRINLPIFVFAGRSNVGKSSVINSIIGKRIAYVSKTPGRTQQINYYLINSKFYFVDLPGYGYANVSKKEVEVWKHLIENFFNQQENVKLVFVIVDIRRGLQDQDRIMFEYLDSLNKEFLVILNKSDKLANNELKERIRTVLSDINRNDVEILPYSAKTGVGKKEIISKLTRLIFL